MTPALSRRASRNAPGPSMGLAIEREQHVADQEAGARGRTVGLDPGDEHGGPGLALRRARQLDRHQRDPEPAGSNVAVLEQLRDRALESWRSATRGRHAAPASASRARACVPRRRSAVRPRSRGAACDRFRSTRRRARRGPCESPARPRRSPAATHGCVYPAAPARGSACPRAAAHHWARGRSPAERRARSSGARDSRPGSRATSVASCSRSSWPTTASLPARRIARCVVTIRPSADQTVPEVACPCGEAIRTTLWPARSTARASEADKSAANSWADRGDWVLGSLMPASYVGSKNSGSPAWGGRACPITRFEAAPAHARSSLPRARARPCTRAAWRPSW